jgi:hypothetical protein
LIVDIRLRVWTSKQAGDFLQVHAKTVIRKAELGIIPGRRIGNRWRFMPDAIRAFMLGQGEDRGPKQGFLGVGECLPCHAHLGGEQNLQAQKRFNSHQAVKFFLRQEIYLGAL